MADIPANATTTAMFGGREGFYGSYSGQLEEPGDRDWIKVDLFAGQTYQFFLSFHEANTVNAGDSILRIYDADGDLVAVNDDRSPTSLNTFIEFSPSSTGTYYIEAAEVGDNAAGSYGLAYTIKSPQEIFHGLTDNADSYAAAPNEIVAGGKGNDVIVVSPNAATAFGEQGHDIISGRNVASQAVGDLIFGGLGNDTIYGLAGGDFLFGDAGNDFIFGGEHGDRIYGGPGADELDGGTGDDSFHIQGSYGKGDVIDGGAGTDAISVDGTGNAVLSEFTAAASSVEVWLGNGKGLKGTSEANVFNFSGLTEKIDLAFVDGKGGDDNLTGSEFADDLRGGSGNDRLSGGAGDDVLAGEAGKDSLTGGAGRGVFDFNKVSDSTVGAQRDVITDFKPGHKDKIDLTGIDAKIGNSGNDKFDFIGKADFSGTKGELRYEDLGATVLVQCDVDGNGKPDFEIKVNVGSLSSGDFIL